MNVPGSPPGGRLARLLDSVGLERNVLVMVASRSVTAFGTLLWSGYLAKVLSSLGADGAAIGAVAAVGAVVSMAFSFIGGGLSDSLGRGRLLIVTTATAVAGYAIYAAAPVWWLFIPGSLLLSASAQAEFLGAQALVGEVVRNDRRSVSIGAQRIVGYLPALISPPLGGLLMERLGVAGGFRIGVAITIGFALASIALQRSLYRLPPPSSPKLSLDVRSAWKAMPGELRWLLLANGLVSFGSRLGSLFAVLFVMDVLDVDAMRYGLFQSLQVALLAFLVVPLGKASDALGRRGRRLFTGVEFLFHAAFSLALGLARSPALLPVVFLLPGVRDSFDSSRKALIIELAGRREAGSVIGLYYLLLGAMTFPASIVAGLLWEWRPRAPFLAGAAACAIGLLVYAATSMLDTRKR